MHRNSIRVPRQAVWERNTKGGLTTRTATQGKPDIGVLSLR